MNFSIPKASVMAVTAVGIWLIASALARGQAPREAVETLRADLKADRQAVIAEQLKLTERESDAFWPIYRSYRTDVDKVTDRVVKLVLEYGDLFPDIPEKRADEMLAEYTKIESDLIGTKRKYFKKLRAVLPASKVFRFAQLDHRYDLGVRVGLAASLPILPGKQTQASEDTAK